MNKKELVYEVIEKGKETSMLRYKSMVTGGHEVIIHDTEWWGKKVR
jgi:hypothetical protein